MSSRPETTRMLMPLRQNLRDMKETLRLSASEVDSRPARVPAWLYFDPLDQMRRAEKPVVTCG